MLALNEVVSIGVISHYSLPSPLIIHYSLRGGYLLTILRLVKASTPSLHL